MSDLGGARQVRFGLAVKFMVPVTAAVSLMIIAMGFAAYDSAAESMSSEIDNAGIFAAKLAAAPEIDSWAPSYNTTADLGRRLGDIAATVELDNGTFEMSDPMEGASTEVMARFQAFDDTQRRANKRRLNGLIGDSAGALDMLIFRRASGGGKELYAWASNRKKSDIRGSDVLEKYSVPSSKGTYIYVKWFAAEDGRLVKARIYEHPIINRKAKTVGWAHAVFSVEGLEAGLERLRGTIIAFCALAILVCAATCYASSKMIMRPLKTLLKDLRAVASGDLAHRTRTHSNDEIGLLAQTFDHMTQNLAAAEEMRVDLADKEHQLQIAQDVQERLFQSELPASGDLRLDAANRLAGDLSSDLFDALILENGQLGCLVMTASGRGFPAAIVLSMARSAFRAVAAGFSSPAAALKTLNGTLSPDLRKGMYVSAMYAIIDPHTGEGRLASAGHRVPGLHFVSSQQGGKKLTGDGIALGLDTGPVFEQSLTEVGFTLEPGDRLVLASEGSFLLLGKDGKPLGDQGFFRSIIRACKADASAKDMLTTVVKGLHAEPGDHDLTLVVAERS